MTTHLDLPGLPGPAIARPATRSDRPALEHLWQLFRHDMSPFSGELPRPDGSYRRERLDLALSEPSSERIWQPWLLTAGEHPVGLALCRAMDEPVRVLNSFFVVAAARREGVGTSFAGAVVAASPGRWTVAHQEANVAAARFWHRVAALFDPDPTVEPRPVPGRPDLAPDVWVGFRVG